MSCAMLDSNCVVSKSSSCLYVSNSASGLRSDSCRLYLTDNVCVLLNVRWLRRTFKHAYTHYHNHQHPYQHVNHNCIRQTWSHHWEVVRFICLPFDTHEIAKINCVLFQHDVPKCVHTIAGGCTRNWRQLASLLVFSLLVSPSKGW